MLPYVAYFENIDLKIVGPIFSCSFRVEARPCIGVINQRTRNGNLNLEKILKFQESMETGSIININEITRTNVIQNESFKVIDRQAYLKQYRVSFQEFESSKY